MVIRLVEELRSPDNPAEIAHGFSVPQVENKKYSSGILNEAANTHPDPSPHQLTATLSANNAIRII